MRKLTTLQAARLLGVSDQSIANWIDSGRLRAGRTPGGHRRIEQDDLVDFLKQQNLRIPAELLSASPTILIVEDEKEVAAWLGEVLHDQCPGYRILTAHDGFVAGEMVMAEHPDLVLLDLYLPGIDGFEVCRRIKSDPRTRGAAVIAMTAHPSPETEKTILDAGAAAYMAKPIDADKLCRLVSQLSPFSR